MEKVRKATADTAKESDKLEKVGEASEKVGAGFLTAGAAAVAAVGLVVKSAADFDAQMSKVQAATNATASEMDKFRNQALTAGASFGYTAEQVTEAQIELGKAGLATKDILGGGLNGVLALAASDNVELGKATQIAAVAMKQFGLSGKDVPHIADELAAGAGKALGGVEQLGDALNQSGLVASNFGFSLEETTGILSSFADAGLLGSDAGTSLKTMLQQLANPSKQSAELMKSLGINVQDANGQFLGAADIAQVLHDKLSTLSDAQRQQALAQIFGSDAVRAATVLYKEGAKGIQEYIDQNNDAGYAMEQARIKSDNLNGDLKKLRSAFQSGLVETGSAADGALRPLVQTMTNVVAAFNDLPEPVKGSALALTGVAGGTSLLAGGLLVAIPKIVEFRAALATLREAGITGKGALGSISGYLTGPWALGIGAGVASVALLNLELAKLKATSAEVGNSLVTAKSAVEIYKTIGQGSYEAPWLDDIQTQFKDLDKVLSDFAQHNSGNFLEAMSSRFASPDTFAAAKALRELNTELGTLQRADPSRAAEAFKLLADQTDGSATSIHRLVDAIGGDYRNALVEQANAMGITASDTNLAQLAMGDYASAAQDAKDPAAAVAAATGDVADSAEDAAQKVSDLVAQIKGLTSDQLDVNSAQRDFESAIDAVTASIEDNGKSLDVSTEKGRANSASLDSIAQSSLNYAGALYQQAGDQKAATDALETGRSSLIAALGQYGVTGQAAQDYADKILGTPKEWATLFDAQTGTASAATQKLQATYNALPKNLRTQVDLSGVSTAQQLLDSFVTRNNGRVISVRQVLVQQAVDAGAAPGAAKAAYKASGGVVRGPGTGTSDSIPAMLSNGEYIIRRSSVDKYGTGFLDRVNAGHYADGGLVATRTEQNKLAKNRFKAAQTAQRQAQSVFNKAKTDANRSALLAAQAETKTARVVAQRAADALTKAKNAPTGADEGDRISFRSAIRDGSYDASTAVRDLYSMGQDSGKYSTRQRASFLSIANKNEVAMLRLQKQSDAAAKAVDNASDKLDDLKSSSTSMASSVSGKLSDFSYGNYRSGSSLLRGLTSRASKLKQFQALLVTLQKNGLAPALLNEVASLGVDEGLPLAKSLASMSKGQLSAINSQYGSIQSTSAAIGGQVADANYKTLIDTAEKQLSAANANADKIAKAIADQSKALQKVIGKALGLPGYSAGGYTGNFGTAQVAGLVHGREFVMNQYATAANRPLLEAMNNGANVRYMDPTPSRMVASGPTKTIEQNNYFQPMPNLDSETVAEISGRAQARYLEGIAG
ncbi:phage tail tape measure protein [Curtobacterium sp. PhB136]|uniref:phage tail tape measure protein n=1 Tax=Curtobacterium sp. PhB136 TaxID=2485181 RepID=UPI00105245C0|nr:phage tail tape measure protein [Curtobacterium sp. PhB136]